MTLTSDQPKLLKSVTTIVKSGILTLKMGSSGTVAVHISGAHHLTSLIVSGQSHVESQNTLVADRFQVISSGSSSFNGSFKVQQLDVQSSGCSKVSFNGSLDTIMLTVSGSSSCHAMGIVTKTAQVTASGSSSVSLKGTADTVSLSVSGCSSCGALHLEVKIAQVTATGSSHASIHCTQTLEVNARGSSNVQYKGNARVVSGSPRKID